MLSDLLNARMRVLLVGPPGIGKTGRIRATAESCGYATVVMRASLCERVDFGGALVPDVENGITRALPLETLHALQGADKPTLLFLDDLGQAPIDVQAALMRLFDAEALSPQVTIWGATNRPADRAGVTSLCEPLRSRFDVSFALPTPDAKEESASGATFLHDWPTELEGWIGWAIGHGIAPEVIGWHRATNGRTLYAWKPSADPGVRMPDYRTWETASRLWNGGMRSLSLMSATLGKPVAAEFTAFAAMADQLATPDQVRADPEGAPIPTEPAPLYLVTSMLSAAANPRDVEPFAIYATRLPRIYGALLMTDLYYSRKLAARMASSPTFVRWFQESPELFAR
jgi:predicted ATPase